MLRNEKTGVLTLSNLSSDHCLVIMESMHTKKFLGRKIFVNCVVPNSPAKVPAETPTTLAKSSTDTGNPVIDEPKSSDSVPLMSSPVLDPRASSLAASKTVNCQTSKISKNAIEEFEFSTPLKSFSQNITNKGLDEMFELANKRKASNSPESQEYSKKEKKAAKKEQKNKSKNEMKAKLQLVVSPSKIV